MFCQKCGNRIEENIVFCPKCGARQPVGVKIEQTVESIVKSPEQKVEKPALSPHSRKTLKKVYELLQKNVSLCPEIKSVVLKDSRSEIAVAGEYNKYKILVSDNPISLSYTPGIPLAIPLTICLVLYCIAGFMFLDGLVFVEILGPAIALNLYGYRIAAAGRKEKKTVMSFIKAVLEQSKYIETPAGLEICLCSIEMLIGVIGIVGKILSYICS